MQQQQQQHMEDGAASRAGGASRVPMGAPVVSCWLLLLNAAYACV